jgi:hypothetical protein
LDCSCCGRLFEPGTPFWHLSIKLWADTNTDFTHLMKSDAEIDSQMASVLERIELLDTESLENEVYQEMAFVLCRDCRDRFTANPLNKTL